LELDLDQDFLPLQFNLLPFLPLDTFKH